MPKLAKLLGIAAKNKKAASFAAFNLIRKASFLEYHLGRGYSLYPDFITFVLTKGCDYKCFFCSSHSVGKKLAPDELTIDQWKAVVDSVSWFKPAIYLCGGEPTLRKDYLDLIRYIKSKGMVCAMTTNASTLRDHKCKDLVESGIDFISISLDGNKDTHNLIRGYKHAFDRVVDAVKSLQKYRGDSPTPHLKLVGVVNPHQPTNALDVLRVAEDLGVDEVNFGHLMHYNDDIERDQGDFIQKYGIGSEYITGGKLEDVVTDTQKMHSVIKEIKANKNVHTTITQGFDLNLEAYYNSRAYPSKRSFCLTPWFSAIVRPNGQVSPCMEFDLGNVKNEKFMKLWNSKGWRTFRKLKAKGEQLPACYRCGEGQVFRFDQEKEAV